MPNDRRLCDALLAKIQEQIERTVHLIGMIPEGRPQFYSLLGHLLDCVAGFCAVLSAAEPTRLAHFAVLRDLPVNHSCPPPEALNRIAIYRAYIDEGFGSITDADLGRPVGTVFVKQGEPLLTLFLGNLEHLINHKHQLFTDLKQIGVSVATADLYHLRGF